MIEITCTEDEKEEITYELATYSMDIDPGCIFVNTNGGECIGKVNCARCAEDNIVWHIRGNEHVGDHH